MGTMMRWLIALMVMVSTVNVASNSFLYDTLKMAGGVREMGMGNAFIAVAEESSALFVNPAGLANDGSFINYELMDYDKAIDSTFEQFSFSTGMFGYGHIRRNSLAGDSAKVAYYGIARQGKNGVDWGLTYKTVESSTNDQSFSSYTLDVGVLMHVTPRLNWGVVGKDILKRDLGIDPTFSTGLAWSDQNRNILIAGDVVQRHVDDDAYVFSRFGLEYRLTDGFFVRLGSERDYGTFGVSLGFPFATVDYAMKHHLRHDEQGIYYLGFKWGKSNRDSNLGRRYALFKKGAFAEFAIGGNLTVGRSVVSLLNGVKIGTNDLLLLMDKAAKDPSCKGYVIRVSSLTNSLATVAIVQELRGAIVKAQRLGKKVYIYLDGYASLPELYLATSADFVMMPELGTIGQLGLDFEIIKTREFFKNFGVGYDILATGEYKGALQPNAKDLTPAGRDQIEGLVNDLYQQVLMTIKKDRNLTWEWVSQTFDGSLISARKGQDMGVIDGLGYWEDMKEYVKENHKGVGRVQLARFDDQKRSGVLFPFFNRIAVIEVDGVINSGTSQSDFLFGMKSTGADDIRSIVNAIKKDPSIRGVILRVNSPGGSMLASDQMYHALKELKESRKKVYTSMGNVAASGGYYVALATDQIWASSTTLTGSIGVISVFQNVERLNEILGIKRDVIKTGPYMDMFSSNRAMTDKEKEKYLAFQKEKYDIFVEKVKSNRNLSEDEVLDVAQGQVFTGEEARRLKLVDRLGSFEETVNALAQDLNIEEPELILFRQPLSILESLLFGAR